MQTRIWMIFFALGLSACGSTHPPPPTSGWDGLDQMDQREELVAFAQNHLKFSGNFRVQGRSFPRDCSGFIASAHYAQGIDIYGGARILNHRGNGVLLLKKHVERYGMLFHQGRPQPGDLVFFSNTYDRNRDGKLNDAWTHVGLVEEVDPNGTVVYLHRGSRAVERSFMNIESSSLHQDRSGRKLNSYLRRRSRRDPPGTQYLSGQVFEAFGTLIRPFPDP